MKFNEIIISKNRHLTILEKNEVNKIFDDKAKRMPSSMRDQLSDIEVLDVEDSVGLTIIILDIGKTFEELKEDRREMKSAAKNTLQKALFLSTMTMATLGGEMFYK